MGGLEERGSQWEEKEMGDFLFYFLTFNISFVLLKYSSCWHLKENS